MEIVKITGQNNFIEQCAALLCVTFACWDTMDNARREMDECLQDERFILAAVENDTVIGFIGGRPEYNGHVWELHPLVVKRDLRCTGIGRQLVAAFETEAAARGGITAYLGTDDEDDSTSLSGCDLYENIYGKMANAANIERHPFEFYQKCGYAIVGVVPDANGCGKPDIMMAKRIATYKIK